MDIFPLVQRVNERLLHLFIEFRIQCIDADHLAKDLLIFIPDLRHRPGNDRKAPLIPPDIFIGNLSRTAVILHGQLFLFCGICRSLRDRFRREGLLSERLHDRRPRELRRHLPVLFIDRPEHFQPALDITFIHKERLVLPVVVFILPVRDRAGVSDLMVLPLRDHARCRPVDHRPESHFTEILRSKPYNLFKSKCVADIYHGFLRQIFPGIYKTDPVSFRIYVRHLLQGLLRQRAQIMRGPQFIFRNIFAETIQIPVIIQVSMFDQICGKRPLRIDLLQDPVRQEHVTVIAGIPVNDVPDLFLFRNRIFSFFPACRLKAVVHFYKQFIEDRQIIHTVFKRIRKP